MFKEAQQHGFHCYKKVGFACRLFVGIYFLDLPHHPGLQSQPGLCICHCCWVGGRSIIYVRNTSTTWTLVVHRTVVHGGDFGVRQDYPLAKKCWSSELRKPKALFEETKFVQFIVHRFIKTCWSPVFARVLHKVYIYIYIFMDISRA